MTKLNPGELDALQPLDPLEVRLNNGQTMKCFYLGYDRPKEIPPGYLHYAIGNAKNGVGLEGALYSFNEIDAIYLLEQSG